MGEKNYKKTKGWATFSMQNSNFFDKTDGGQLCKHGVFDAYSSFGYYYNGGNKK